MTTTVSTTTFESLDPRTGDVVGTHPVNTPEEVRAAVERAHEEATWWSALSFDEREKQLQTWKGAMTRRLAQLAEVMHRETGKPHGDAMLEAALAIDHLSWAASHAEKVMKRRKVPSGLLMANQAAYVEYQPLGVIGVIGPWNYPVFTPMGSIGYALAAGNAVVFKPSEYTPGVGEWLARTFLESVGRPVLQVVTGYGETGHALCTSGVDKVAFTGSTATGKKVMAACAETLTPVVIEAGGKDALIVDEDADVDAAADAAVWGSMTNAGQTCIGIERAYVVAPVYDAFVQAVVEKAGKLRIGEEIGPITMPKQLDVIREHIEDALAKGGRAVLGGAEAVKPPYVGPTVLVDVPDDAAAIAEETFGPTLTITKVADADEAVRKANNTAYGLGGSVFGKRDAVRIARRLRSGMVAVNSTLTFVGMATLPFGGTGDSGFGRVHGEDGLREFARAKAITVRRGPSVIPAQSYDRTPGHISALIKTLRLLYGRRT
jgi:acyl-CoA reductase-like NAD-dependent aldehyde dehydrogenase